MVLERRTAMEQPDDEVRTWFEVLEVDHDAGVREIDEAYRRRRAEALGDPDEAALVDEAYRVLSNAFSRAGYQSRLDPIGAAAFGAERDLPFSRMEMAPTGSRGFHRFAISALLVLIGMVIATFIGVALFKVIGQSEGSVRFLWLLLVMVIFVGIAGVVWAFKDMS